MLSSQLCLGYSDGLNLGVKGNKLIVEYLVSKDQGTSHYRKKDAAVATESAICQAGQKHGRHRLYRVSGQASTR
jgi:hypothetical protein